MFDSGKGQLLTGSTFNNWMFYSSKQNWPERIYRLGIPSPLKSIRQCAHPVNKKTNNYLKRRGSDSAILHELSKLFNFIIL